MRPIIQHLHVSANISGTHWNNGDTAYIHLLWLVVEPPLIRRTCPNTRRGVFSAYFLTISWLKIAHTTYLRLSFLVPRDAGVSIVVHYEVQHCKKPVEEEEEEVGAP